MKQFISEVKDFGFDVAIKNALISFTYDFIGAKSMNITYEK